MLLPSPIFTSSPWRDLASGIRKLCDGGRLILNCAGVSEQERLTINTVVAVPSGADLVDRHLASRVAEAGRRSVHPDTMMFHAPSTLASIASHRAGTSGGLCSVVGPGSLAASCMIASARLADPNSSRLLLLGIIELVPGSPFRAPSATWWIVERVVCDSSSRFDPRTARYV